MVSCLDLKVAPGEDVRLEIPRRLGSLLSTLWFMPTSSSSPIDPSSSLLNASVKEPASCTYSPSSPIGVSKNPFDELPTSSSCNVAILNYLCCSTFYLKTAIWCMSWRLTKFICFILRAVFSKSSYTAGISKWFCKIGWSFFFKSPLPIWAFSFSFWI